jgi:hypothetical protein
LARAAPISPDFSNSIPDHKLEERFQLNFVVMPSELLREASSAAARGHFLKAPPKWFQARFEQHMHILSHR